MTVFRPILWTAAGALMLSACGGEGGEAGKTGEAGTQPPAAAGEGGEGEGGEGEGGASGGGEAGAADAYAGVPAASRPALRLAHLKGFYLAALAAQPAEGNDAAAALAGQGLLEVHDPAAAEVRATGVDEQVLRAAARSGDPAALRRAVKAIETAETKAGGDPAAVARGLAAIATGLYRGVVVDGAVDPVEYQHAYGAALALKAAADRSPALAGARKDVQAFVALWPSPTAPTEVAKAPAFSAVQAQASRVELALAGA